MIRITIRPKVIFQRVELSAHDFSAKCVPGKQCWRYFNDMFFCYSVTNNIWLCCAIITKLNLTHWGRVTHICIGKLTIIGSDNGLLPGWRQAIIWNNARILLIGALGTNFSEILIEILPFSFTKMSLKVSAILSRPQCVKRSWRSCEISSAILKNRTQRLVQYKDGFFPV